MRAKRRSFLSRAAACAAAAAMLKHRSLAATPRDAFDARSLRQALEAAGYADARPTAGIRIEAPGLADNPALVPIQIESALAETRAVALFIDRNPFPYIARFDFHAGAAPFVRLRARVAESSLLRVVAVTPEGLFSATRPVQAAAGGCSAEDAEAPGFPEPPPPIKMRAQAEGPGAELRVLMTHPMENGLRKTTDGATIPERFIRSVLVRLNGEAVIAAALGRSMSQDPLLVLRLARATPGDRVELGWRDSSGASRSDETRVA